MFCQISPIGRVLVGEGALALPQFGHCELQKQMRLAENIFHFVKEAGAAFGGFVLRFQNLAQLFHDAFLLARQLRRNIHAHIDVQIAFSPVRVRQTLALLAENLPRLRALRNFQILFGAQSGHANFCAERRLRKRNRNGAEKICVAPLKVRMLFDLEEDVQIAGRAAVGARFAFAREPEPRFGIDTGRNRNFKNFLALDSSLPPALRAGLANRLPSPLARGASPRNRKEALLIMKLAAPGASLARRHSAARLRAGSVAPSTILVTENFDLGANASRGFLESQRKIVAKISSALSPTRAATLTAASAAQDVSHPK